MATFKFRLETLLKLREAARDECRAKLGEAVQAEQVLQRQMSQVAFELSTMREQARTSGRVGEVNVDLLLSAHRYELLLHSQHQQLDAQAQQVAEEIERRRQVVVEADKQVRILEQLRDKQRAEFEFAERRQEMKNLDEVAGQQFIRSQGTHSRELT